MDAMQATLVGIGILAVILFNFVYISKALKLKRKFTGMLSDFFSKLAQCVVWIALLESGFFIIAIIVLVTTQEGPASEAIQYAAPIMVILIITLFGFGLRMLKVLNKLEKTFSFK